MEVKPNYCSMDTVFGESTIFLVPKYQRAYSWEKSNVVQFCDDLYELYEQKKEKDSVGQHFLGGIVCVRQGNEDELDEKVVYQLVDGQQRLSTTVLLISRLVHHLQSLKLTDAESEIRNKRVLKYKSKFVSLITEENGKDIESSRITLSKRDDDYYQNALNNILPDSKIKSHQLIKKAASEIDKWLNKFDSDESQLTLNNFDLMYRVLCKSCRILLLKMTNVTDAYRLFQVINDRGRSLTAGDLLRASSLGAVDKANVEGINLNELEAKWDSITEKGAKTTDSNLISYYTSKMGKAAKRANLFEDFNSSFFDDENLISNRICDIETELNMLKRLSDGSWPYDNSNLHYSQKSKLYSLVVQFKHSHCLPLLLAATKLKENKFYQLIFFLEKFFFVFKVCLDKRMTPVTKAYYSAIEKINKDPKAYQVKWFCDDLKSVILKLSLPEIASKLRTIEYQKDGDNKDLKYLLLSLEESDRWVGNQYKKSYLGLYKHHSRVLSNFSAYSIEHIYPDSAKDGDKKAPLELVKNQLGNLTLLYQQENELCGNNLIKLKNVYYDQSRINIAKELAHHETFTLEDKNIREIDLLKRLLMIFTFGFVNESEINKVFDHNDK